MKKLILKQHTLEIVLLTTDKKLDIPIVILSTQDNSELLQHLKLEFERTTNWNQYQSKVSKQAQNQYLHFSIDPSFQRVHSLFVFLYSFENDTDNFFI